MSALPRPPGHHTITPAFIVRDAAAVLDWIVRAFDGKVVDRYEGPNGIIAHAEVMIGDSVVMLGEAHGMDPMPAALSYYVEDGDAVDRIYARALEMGATVERAPENQFYGYRSATVRDSGGNRWTICAVIELVSPEEMQRRMNGMQG